MTTPQRTDDDSCIYQPPLTGAPPRYPVMYQYPVFPPLIASETAELRAEIADLKREIEALKLQMKEMENEVLK